jgi:hypothetical protein
MIKIHNKTRPAKIQSLTYYFEWKEKLKLNEKTTSRIYTGFRFKLVSSGTFLSWIRFDTEKNMILPRFLSTSGHFNLRN